MESIGDFEKEEFGPDNNLIAHWMPDYQFVIDLIPKLLRVYRHKNKHVLVAGCGSGEEIISFLKSKTDWIITGIDPSSHLLNIAHQKLNKYGRKNKVTLLNKRVSDIDHVFGAATSIMLMNRLEGNRNKHSFLESIASKLEVNSPFVIVDIFGTPKSVKKNLALLAMKLPSFIQQNDIDYYFHWIKNETQYISEKNFSDLLRETGFKPPLRFYHNTIYSGWIMRKS